MMDSNLTSWEAVAQHILRMLPDHPGDSSSESKLL